MHELFLKYASEIDAFVSRRWPGERDSADIVQDSFVRLLEYPKPECIRNPRAFLLQTAANLVVDRYRRARIREHYSAGETDVEQVPDVRASPHRYWEAHEALDHLNQWLADLPELQRHAFVLFRFEGFSHAEIAQRLGISVRSSERHARLALKSLTERMDRLSE
ncbi:MAG: RNA polymerase sigma factor [Methylococcales bacterium]